MSATKPRVLIADDEEALLSVLREYLGCCGYDVATATRPSEAKDLLSAAEYAVVITDLRFWGVDGTQGLAIARAARERMPSGRVFLLTAYNTPEVEKEAREIGVEALLEKPMPLWRLAQLITGATPPDAPRH
jgi:two-component system response regulator (stage 0 sporulation protein F)